MDDDRLRCEWVGGDEQMRHYHDREWGVPVHDDRKWFEYLVLDAFQAGLSWRTVLHRREAFRSVFHGFDPVEVVRMTESEIAQAVLNPAIIRNRQKIAAAVSNAGAFLDLQAKQGSFDEYIWSFTDGAVVQNAWRGTDDLPASTPLSDVISNELKRKGFSFFGTTICYAFLQAGGIVNDHQVECFRYQELSSGPGDHSI